LQNRAALHVYVDSLQLGANFSGVQVIGVVEQVSPAHRAAHVAAMRALGLAAYNIEPAGERDVYAPIVQREPYSSENHARLGVDLWPDAVRRTAMETARDSGLAAITGKVRLKIDTQAVARPGFIMYLPVFAQGQPHDNVAQRRQHLVGWVYAAFYMSDFMASLYGAQSPGLSLAIYAGVDPQEDVLLYRSDTGGTAEDTAKAAAAMHADEFMVVGGQPWTLSLRTQPAFEERYGRDSEFVIALSGSVLSVVLALLVSLMVSGRARATQLAEAMTQELRHMAQHDALTGLPNRALFDDRLGQELARARRRDGFFALAFLDLDKFKPINDNFGHAVGDRVLQQVAKRLQECIRAEDTVGRIGGDEFVLLLTGLLTPDSVLDLAEKIRQRLHESFVVDGHRLTLSCSIGVAIYPRDGTDAITLTKIADDAMYRAKAEGSDCIRLSQTTPFSAPTGNPCGLATPT
jgi:diguanylate cyclase (GGDEF)-like protein